MKKFKDGYFSLIENVPFHDMYGNKRRKEYTSYLIYKLIGLSIPLEEIQVWSEKILEKVSFDDKEVRCDVVVETKDYIINMEAYTDFNNESLRKTIFYGDKLNVSQLEIGDSYKKGKKVIQIVLARDIKIKLNKTLITENMLSKDSIVLSDTRKIILVRLDKIDTVGYNNEKIWLLKYLNASSQKERDSIVKEGGDIMLKKMNEFVKRFMNNKEAGKKYEKYNFQQKIWEESGRNEGIESIKCKIVENMYRQGFSVESISNTVEIPVHEINQILNKL